MYQFFVDKEQVSEKEAVILGSDVNHIRNVLRMKPGEKIGINDGCRNWLCAITQIDEDRVTAQIEEELKDTELPSKIYLFQGLPKSDKLESIIQKCVELGAFEIIPVAMKRCIVKVEEKKQDAKVKRWQTIAESAAKQSKRGLIPQVTKVMSWKDALQAAAKLDVFLLPFEHADGMAQTRKVLSEIPRGASIGIMIGPEGGFEDEEVEQAQKLGAKVITLGHRILRTETAGPAALAMLIYCIEED